MSKRNGAIVLLAAASLVLLVSLVTRGWFRERRDVETVSLSFGMGVWGQAYSETCGDAVEKRLGKRCHHDTATLSFDKVSGAKATAWLLFGRLTMIFGIASVLALLGALGLLIKRHPLAKRLWLVPLIGVGITMFDAGMFLALQPDGSTKIGYSVFLFFPAAVAGIFGSLMLRDAVDEQRQARIPGLGER